MHRVSWCTWIVLDCICQVALHPPRCSASSSPTASRSASRTAPSSASSSRCLVALLPMCIARCSERFHAACMQHLSPPTTACLLTLGIAQPTSIFESQALQQSVPCAVLLILSSFLALLVVLIRSCAPPTGQASGGAVAVRSGCHLLRVCTSRQGALQALLVCSDTALCISTVLTG
jgi:hypothetical protein